MLSTRMPSATGAVCWCALFERTIPAAFVPAVKTAPLYLGCQNTFLHGLSVRPEHPSLR